jgi:phosphotransacetylase
MAKNNINILTNIVRRGTGRRLVVANGYDSHSIQASYHALKMDIASVIVTCERKLFLDQCKKIGIPSSDFTIIDSENEDMAMSLAVKMVREGNADLIMKGMISTDKFMKAFLSKKEGLLLPGQLVSHITIVSTPLYSKLLLVGDVAIIPLPTLEQKKIITEHLISMAHKIGIETPKVAFIAATEKVIDSMSATVDAKKLKELWEEGGFSQSICDGPMGLDLALDKESASIKKFVSPVAGDADCLLFPNIESGNVFYKSNTKLCKASTAAIIVGAKVPAILSSRGDNVDTKINSIALASIVD